MLVSFNRHLTLFVTILIILSAAKGFAQEYTEYEEISIFLDVPVIGGADTDVLIKDQEVFLPITDLFDLLKIKNNPSDNLDSITGFFLNPQTKYVIDRTNNRIKFEKEVYDLKPGELIRTESNLYLKSDYFGKIFGIDCIFSFRNLSVAVNTRFELPIMRELRQEEIRKNLNRVIEEVEADTNIARRYPLFQFGMADWTVIGTEQTEGLSEIRLNLNLGAMLLGGEANVSLNYNSNYTFSHRQQFYRWRYVNNDLKAIRQVIAGKIPVVSTSSIFDPVIGAQLTNTPSTFRRSFGTYTISDQTEPGWMVELYVNNVLVDYVKADASGFFTFEVPLVYGNTLVRLRFYGPFGEERIRERFITTPFNFIPKNKLEYSVSAGIVEDSVWSRFSRANVNYGLTRGITLGAGYEYLSSVSSGPFMPFVTGSFRLAPNLLLTGEYTHSVRARAALTFRLASNLQFDIDYINYADGQTAIYYNFLEERKVSLSLPFRIKKFSAFSKISVNQLILPSSNYTTGEWLISASLSRFNANITSYAILINNKNPNIYSNFSLSVRLPLAFTIVPQMQYSYTEKMVISSKLGIEKRLFEFGYLTMSYEQNFKSNLRLAEIGFRYDFKFAQAGISAINTNNNNAFIQYARGSIINDRKSKYLGAERITQVGRGGIALIPYLDVNANNKKDPGEPMVFNLNVRASGGQIKRNEKDTIIRILNLEPYNDCFVELDPSSFKNIAWRLEKNTMNVAIDPNVLKVIEIPIKVVGEASGMVYLERKRQKRGISRILVDIFTKNEKAGQVLTEIDGYYSYFGLPPGEYYARIDTVQLNKLGLGSSPDTINFSIEANTIGDYIDGLDFTLYRLADKKDAPAPDILPVPWDTSQTITHRITKEDTNTKTDSYNIRTAAFTAIADADTLKKKLSAEIQNEIAIIEENDVYKLEIKDFKSESEAEQIIPVIQNEGVDEIWIVTLKGAQDQQITYADVDTKEQATETDSPMITHQLSEVVISADKGNYAIQLCVIQNRVEAELLQSKLNPKLKKEIEILETDGSFKLRINGYQTEEEVEQEVQILKINGIDEVWIITLEQAPPTNIVTTTLNSGTDVIEAITGKDTAYLIVHEVFKEVVTSSTDSYAIQLGAFRSKANAYNYRNKLNGLLDEFVEVIIENGYYKVRIVNLENRADVTNYIPTLVKNNINEIWVVHLKGMQKQLFVSTQMDTIDDGSDEIIATDRNKFILQLGAFKIKSNAYNYRKKLVGLFGTEFKILRTDDYYKVRIGFPARKEINSFIPVLKKKDVKEMWLVPPLNEIK